eukprot:12732887-Heterocapsa_arctica.AAC.1
MANLPSPVDILAKVMANDDVAVRAHIEISMDGSHRPDDTEEQTKADRPRHPEDRMVEQNATMRCN